MKNDIINVITDIFGDIKIEDGNNTLTIDFKDVEKQIKINYLDQSYIEYETTLWDDGRKCIGKTESRYRDLNDIKGSLKFFKTYRLGIGE